MLVMGETQVSSPERWAYKITEIWEPNYRDLELWGKRRETRRRCRKLTGEQQHFQEKGVVGGKIINGRIEDNFYEPKKNTGCGLEGFAKFQTRWIRKDRDLGPSCRNLQTLKMERSSYKLPGGNSKLPPKEKESNWRGTFLLPHLEDWRWWKSTESWANRSKTLTSRFHRGCQKYTPPWSVWKNGLIMMLTVSEET